MSSEAKRCEPDIRYFRQSDIEAVASRMRQADQWEIWHGSRRGAREALQRGVDVSFHVRTITYGDTPVAIYGLAADAVGACPWMLGTDDLAKCWGLLRECRGLTQTWAQEHGYLSNAVWAGNTTHIRWLKWLGFTFDGSDLRNGETFLHFHRSSQCANQQPSWP